MSAACGGTEDNGSDQNAVCAPNCAGASGVDGASGVGGMVVTGGAGGMDIVTGMAGVGTGGVGGMDPMMAGAAGIAGTGTGGAAGMGTGGAAGMGTGGVAGMDPMAGGEGGAAGMMAMDEGCTPAPTGAVTDYGARGPFQVMQVNSTGPSNQYTMFRPTTLGEGGFMHPPVSWGNGVSTTPALYVELLSTVASHGFVVIASNSTSMTAALVKQGLEWLIDQNGSGELAGKLAVDCAGLIGYSMGGGSAVGAGDHPNVKAIVSMHGLNAAAENVSGPLLLITSDNDGFVTKSMFVMPTYTRSSRVPTIMATLETGLPADFAGHLIPLGDAGEDRAPLVGWLRYWIYGDQGARDWFYGADCKLCRDPWIDIQRKNHTWD
jgi:hypothetical protein